MGLAKSVSVRAPALPRSRAPALGASVLAGLLLPVAAHAWTLATLYSFQGGSDGANPYAGLLDFGGALYGTTEVGGTSGGGTVFKIDPATGAESVIHSFGSGSDGTNPLAALISDGGRLYGTTADGGASHTGIVFKIDPTTGTEKILHAFGYDGSPDGAAPEAPLLLVAGTLYGTTINGGSGSCISGLDTCGTVFKVNHATGAETVLYSFQGGRDGDLPTAALVEVGGALYGTTTGAQAYSTVFKIDRTTGAETVLHVFNGYPTDGSSSAAALISVGGILYGTTASGGAGCPFDGCGTVFNIDPATGAETVVYSFVGGSDGAYPDAALIQVGGALYGTTAAGGGGTDCGGAGCGTVFKIHPATGAETVLHSFTIGDGASPEAALINVGGVLYGTTSSGGAYGYGTVFSLTP